jgi:hypothetical protein
MHTQSASRSVPLTKYHSDDQIEKIEVGWECSRYGGERRGPYRVFVGKPEGTQATWKTKV